MRPCTASGRPRYASGYAELVFSVAVADAAILEIRYWKRGAAAPTKLLRAPRASIRRFDGVSLPTRIVVENHARRTRTEVKIDRIEVGVALDDSLFTASSLAAGRAVPIAAEP